MEICCKANELLNGKELAGIGTLHYIKAQCGTAGEYDLCTLRLSVNTNRFPQYGGFNLLAEYHTDSEAMLKELMKDSELKQLMGAGSLTDTELYRGGHLCGTETVQHNSDNGLGSWVSVVWDFSDGVCVNVSAFSRDKTQLPAMSKRILQRLDGFKLPIRGTLRFEKARSVMEEQLDESLYAARLIFG